MLLFFFFSSFLFAGGDELTAVTAWLVWDTWLINAAGACVLYTAQEKAARALLTVRLIL